MILLKFREIPNWRSFLVILHVHLAERKSIQTQMTQALHLGQGYNFFLRSMRQELV